MTVLILTQQQRQTPTTLEKRKNSYKRSKRGVIHYTTHKTPSVLRSVATLDARERERERENDDDHNSNNNKHRETSSSSLSSGVVVPTRRRRRRRRRESVLCLFVEWASSSSTKNDK